MGLEVYGQNGDKPKRRPQFIVIIVIENIKTSENGDSQNVKHKNTTVNTFIGLVTIPPKSLAVDIYETFFRRFACRRFGIRRFALSPFWSVAVLTMHLPRACMRLNMVTWSI